MRLGRSTVVVWGALAISQWAFAPVQVSVPGPPGPLIQDRMIFFEAALLQMDRRVQTLETTLKLREAQIARLEKDLQSVRDKAAAFEKRVAALEAKFPTESL